MNKNILPFILVLFFGLTAFAFAQSPSVIVEYYENTSGEMYVRTPDGEVACFGGRLPFTWRNPEPDHESLDKAADAILRFERSTGFKPFKRFHIEQAISFKAQLDKEKATTTGKPLSKATISSVLRAVKSRNRAGPRSGCRSRHWRRCRWRWRR